MYENCMFKNCIKLFANCKDDFQIKSLKTETDYFQSSFHLLGHVWGPDRTTFACLVIRFSPLSKSNKCLKIVFLLGGYSFILFSLRQSHYGVQLMFNNHDLESQIIIFIKTFYKIVN